MEANWSWLTWQAVNVLRTHKATTDNVDFKVHKLTKGTLFINFSLLALK